MALRKQVLRWPIGPPGRCTDTPFINAKSVGFMNSTDKDGLPMRLPS